MQFESRWVKSGQINTHYIVGGSGPPLVLINGGGAGGVDEDWAPNLRPLAQHYTIYALDKVGYGKSDKPKADYTMQFFYDFFEDFVYATGLERMHLMGHSLGGAMALWFTLKYPDKVDKLVLIDSGGLSNEVGIAGNIIIPVFKLAAKFKRNGTYLSLMTGGNNHDLPEVFMDRLHQIRAPTLLVWGEWDGYVPVKLARRAHERLRNSQLHIFKRGWHSPHRKNPEEFNRLVLEFLGN